MKRSELCSASRVFHQNNQEADVFILSIEAILKILFKASLTEILRGTATIFVPFTLTCKKYLMQDTTKSMNSKACLSSTVLLESFHTLCLQNTA